MGKVSRIVLILAVAVCSACAPAAKENAQRDKATLHYQLGLGGIAQHDFTGALSELLRAVEFDPENAEIQHALGLAYHGKGRAREAIAAYKKALQIDPDFSAAWNNMGIVYLSLHSYTKARQAFNKALENILYPHPENAYLNLGLLALEESKPEEAVRYFGRAKKAAPRFCGAYYYSGKALDKQKEYNLAIENLKLAIKFCPDFAEAYRFAGTLWLKKRKPKTALRYFEKAHELAPETDVGRESYRYIKLLKRKRKPS